MNGRRSSTHGNIFLFRDSAYADDTAASFTSRSNLSTGAIELVNHFQRFGMKIHTGSPGKYSKIEILFVPRPSHSSSSSRHATAANFPPQSLVTQSSSQL